jgi:hypothetical protein
MDQRKEFFDVQQMALAPNVSLLIQTAHLVQINMSWEPFSFSFCSDSLLPIDENFKAVQFIKQRPSLQPVLGSHLIDP